MPLLLPTIGASPILEQLIETRMPHDAFPLNILQGMQSPAGASMQAVQELDRFIHDFFAFNLPKSFFIQMAVAGSWIAVLLVLGICVIIHRITKRAFWLFKFQRRSEGIYIVPNALNTFLLFQGCFGIVWLAFIIAQYKAYWEERPSMQYHIAVLNLIIWWPLWIGAFMAGWGSFYTAPGALDRGPLSSSWVGKLAPRPLLINICCLGTPFLLISSLLAPIILAQIHFNTAFDAYRTFHDEIFSALIATPTQRLSTATAQHFLSRASNVWQMQTTSAWFECIGYTIWSVWAGVFMLFYVPAGGYLCWMVWQQLQTQSSILLDMNLKRKELEEQEQKRRREKGLERETEVEPNPEESLLFQPLTSSQDLQQRDKLQQAQQAVGEKREGTRGERNVRPASPRSQRTAVTSKDKESDGEIFFPPLRPEMRKRAIKRISVSGTPRSRYNYLRRCFINLMILYIGIVMGAAVYLGVSAALARSLYETYRQNPQKIAELVKNTCCAAAWGAVIFGTLTVFAIFARFADPANVTISEQRAQDRGRGRTPRFFKSLRALTPSSHQDSSATLNEPPAQDPHARTRTLPAVPESVAAASTFDPLQSTATASSLPRSKARRGLFGGTINFRLQEKAGNLILRPSEQESMTTNNYELEEVLESASGSGSRLAALQSVPQDVTQGSITEDESQTASRRSNRNGNVVYHPTKHGDMPVPAPPAPKPLPPERSPPLSPTRFEEPTRPEPAAPPFAPYRRPSQWELLQRQERRKEAQFQQQRTLRARQRSLSSVVPSHPSSYEVPTDLSYSRRASRASAALPELSAPPPAGPPPATPSTASTFNFPPTPVYSTQALPDLAVKGYSPPSTLLPIVDLEPPPASKRLDRLRTPLVSLHQLRPSTTSAATYISPSSALSAHAPAPASSSFAYTTTHSRTSLRRQSPGVFF